MDRDEENTKLLERILEAIKVGNENEATIIANQKQELAKLDQIIQNTTPAKSDDIVSLGGSISTPVKKNP